MKVRLQSYSNSSNKLGSASMTRWRRIAFGLAAGACVLGISAAVALHVLASPDRLKTQVREKVLQGWSRDLAIGDISLHILPLPSLHATNVAVADAPGAKDPWSLHADQVVVGLSPWSLLKGEARPRNLFIKGDVTHLGRRMQVTGELSDISRYAQPDATSNGEIDLDWGTTRISIRGTIPLQPQLHGAALDARLESQNLNDMLGFFAIERPRATARAKAALELRSSDGRIDLLNVAATLGQFKAEGDAHISTSETGRVIEARLHGGRLDWRQTLLDSGAAPLAPLPPDELFYDSPIAWPLLVWLQQARGTIDARLDGLLLRNGVELRGATASIVFEGDQLKFRTFTTSLLGGSATGTMQFAGRKKEARITIEGKNLLLERWFSERSRQVPFSGGPMAITASLTATGNSMRELAKSITGPVEIRMGPGEYRSQKAGDAEAMMIAFSKRATGRIAVECAAAKLPFVQGRADGSAIVGARSDVSRLLASGYVSLRDEAVELRGHLQPKPGMGVGLAAIAGDVRIAGKIRAMHVTLDPAAAPKVALRAGAAIATLGLSLAGSAMANARREDRDPCEAVFEKQHV